MATPTFQCYSRPEYFIDLAERAATLGKGDSITLMTMNFDPQVPLINRLMQRLCGAASRGTEVRLIVDAMDFILNEKSRPGPLFVGRDPSAKSHGPFADRFAHLEKLRQAGGHYWIINKPLRKFANPVSGRSHIKLALINDRVYLGGCNLDDEKRIDIMAAWNDEKTSAWLRDLTEKIAAVGNVKQALTIIDLTHKINDSMTIFVDSGVKKQSIIYDQALKFIDTAKKKLLITCQYFPGGPTAQHLLAAQKRGTNVEIIFSGPASHSQALGHYLYNLRERTRMPADFFAKQLPSDGPKMHAKIIATENGVLLGSHNYVDIGVRLGTAEIALKVDDPKFAQNIAKCLTKQLV